MTKKPCKHSDNVDGCQFCFLYEHNPAVRARWDGVPYQQAHDAPDCIHLGIRVHPPEAPDNVKDWRRCDKGHGVVCPCGACKTCGDYEAD